MELVNLLENVDFELIFGNIETEITSLEYNSKSVIEGSLFFAIDGYENRGIEYIDEAISKGAKAVVCNDLPRATFDKELEFTLIKVKDVRKALAYMSSAFYNNPSGQMLVVGVTGTKGKTSVTFMIKSILECARVKTGIIGTVIKGYDGNYLDSDSTTPQSKDIQELMNQMLLAGCKAVVMEVSSQGLKHSRVESIDFNIGVFTNIFPDHIGASEHDSYEEYLNCKRHLFDLCEIAVANGDWRESKRVCDSARLEKKVLYGKCMEADFRLKEISYWTEAGSLGSKFKIDCGMGDGQVEDMAFSIPLPGEFNVYNALAAIATTKSLGISWSAIQEGLKNIRVPGRTEIINISDDFVAMLDYAHNGMALENLLKAIRMYNPKRIILVFGCGGNRDKNRRYEMGRVASEYADYIIITSDNPRSERPEDIIKDIKRDMNFEKCTVETITSRREAIRRAISLGEKGDVVVVAGKGHEKYQIIGDEILFFDDKEEILSCGKDLK